MPGQLLAKLKLPPPPKAVPVAPSSGKAAEVSKEINEAAKFAADLGNEEAKGELAKALKLAEEQRKSALELGDQTEREKGLKGALETVKKARQRAAEQFGAKPEAKDDKKDESSRSVKGGAKGITDKGKFGAANGREFEAEKKTAKGDVVKCSASFEGKAWVETKPIAYSEPPEVEITFHLTLGAKAGGSASRERDSGGAKAAASVSAEYELAFKRKMNADETKRYVADVKAGRSGGWEELKALELAVRGSVTEARALMARLGGSKRVMKDDDETEETLSGKAEASLGLSGKRGAFGIGLDLDGSVSGSLTRKVAMTDGSYWITLRSSKGKQGSAGAGFSLEGVGMNMTASREEHSSEAVTFIIDPAKPALKPLLVKVLAATSIEQMLALRDANRGVAVFDTKTSSKGQGGSTSASVLGLGLTVDDQAMQSQTEIVGPDGITRIYTGAGTTGASGTVGSKKYGATSSTDQFSGGAGADNKGFGETSNTKRDTDLLAGLRELADKGVKSPITTLKNLKDGKQEIAKEVVHQEGAALTDDSYALLASRAKGGLNQWTKYWRGNIASYQDWKATYAKVRAAGDNRQKIAQAIAAFEGVAGRGRHETVRNAIAGTEIAFEFPDAMASKKPFYDSLIVADPLPAALALGKPEAVLAKLAEITRQLDGLRADMSKAQAAFGRPDDYQDMCERIDQRREVVRVAVRDAAAKARAAAEAAEAEKKQYTPAGPNQSMVDPQDERQRVEDLQRKVNELKLNVSDAYAEEQRVFTAWEVDLKGFTVLGVSLSNPDLSKLLRHQDRLRGLYPKWDKAREELRKALRNAGAGFDPAEADVLQPDRPRYRKLRASGPNAGFNMPDGV